MQPITNLRTLMDRVYPEQSWVVDGLVPASAITIMSGAPACRKTWTLLDMAIAVASGIPLFGHFATEQTGVLIIDEENGERLLQQRLKLLGADRSLPIYFYSLQQYVLNDDMVDYTVELCKRNDVGLIVIDSLVRIHASDENKSGDMAEVFKLLKRFAVEDISTLITHHNKKPGPGNYGISNEMRGSSDILAAVDSHLALVRKDNKIVFHQTKQRYAEEIDPFEVQVVSDGEAINLEYVGSLGKEDKEATIRTAILSLLVETERMFQQEILGSLKLRDIKVNEHKLRKMLHEMRESGVVTEEQGPGNTKFYRMAENDDA